MTLQLETLPDLNMTRAHDTSPFDRLDRNRLRASAGFVAARSDGRATGTGDQFITAVEDALAHDQPALARLLAQQGQRLHPQNVHLTRLSAILASPRAIADDLPADPDLDADLVWLRMHRAEYTGQWVAVVKGEFQGVAPTLRELKHALGDLKGMLVTRVL